jgi:DNA-binding MltR family transcriptional regulator
MKQPKGPQQFTDEAKLSYFQAFTQETDRSVAILSAIYLDNLLGSYILSTFYVQDANALLLFNDDKMLQSFHNKICLAYHLGLIPDPIYNDLKTICTIRNIFAHQTPADLTFNKEIIVNKTKLFAQIPDGVKSIYSSKTKFMLVVVQIGACLNTWTSIVAKQKVKSYVEALDLAPKDYKSMILTPDEIKKVLGTSGLD